MGAKANVGSRGKIISQSICGRFTYRISQRLKEAPLIISLGVEIILLNTVTVDLLSEKVLERETSCVLGLMTLHCRQGLVTRATGPRAIIEEPHSIEGSPNSSDINNSSADAPEADEGREMIIPEAPIKAIEDINKLGIDEKAQLMISDQSTRPIEHTNNQLLDDLEPSFNQHPDWPANSEPIHRAVPCEAFVMRIWSLRIELRIWAGRRGPSFTCYISTKGEAPLEDGKRRIRVVAVQLVF